METRRLGVRGAPDTPAQDGRDDTALFEVVIADKLLIVCRGAVLRAWIEGGGGGADAVTYFLRASLETRRISRAAAAVKQQ